MFLLRWLIFMLIFMKMLVNLRVILKLEVFNEINKIVDILVI